MGERRYGAWAGNPKGMPEDPARCIKEVGTIGGFHQCPRKRGSGPEGLYCKQHDPAAIEAKRKAQREKVDAQSEISRRRYDNAAVGAWLRENDPERFAEILRRNTEILKGIK